jgi:hypothetical protein
LDPVVAGDTSTELTWTYSYTGDDLAGVCTPENKCTTYGYANGSQFPSAVLDSDPQSYWRLDESSGTTAASSVLASEQTDAGTYSATPSTVAGPLSGGSASAAVFGGSNYVTLPSSLIGAGAVEWSVSLWFKTTGSSEVLFSHSATAITAGSSTGYYQPDLYVGSDGKLFGAVGTSGDVETSNAVNDGGWHHVVLAVSDSKLWLFLDGSQVGTAVPGPDSTAEPYTYVGTGYLGGHWGDESNSGNTGTPHGFDGAVSDVAYYARPLTAAEDGDLHTDGTRAAQLLTKMTRPSGDVAAQVGYDGVTGRVTQVTDANGGTWRVAAPTVTGSSGVYSSAVLGSEAHDYWPLGEAAGSTAAVSRIYGAAGQYNDVSLGQPGLFSDQTTASFGGTDSRVDMPYELIGSGAQTWSVALWFKTTGTNEVLFSHSAAAITAGSATGYYQPSLYVGEGGRLIGAVGASGYVRSSVNVNDGAWHQAILTVSSSTVALYLDGTQVGTATPDPDSLSEPYSMRRIRATLRRRPISPARSVTSPIGTPPSIPRPSRTCMRRRRTPAESRR